MVLIDDALSDSRRANGRRTAATTGTQREKEEKAGKNRGEMLLKDIRSCQAMRYLDSGLISAATAEKAI